MFPRIPRVLRKRDEAAVGQRQAKTAEGDHRSERRDERIDAQPHDDHGVDASEREPGDYSGQHGCRKRQASVVQGDREDGRSDISDRAHGNIELAAHHDQRHARGDDDHRRDDMNDVEKVLQAEEARRRERKDGVGDAQDDQRPEIAQPRESSHHAATSCGAVSESAWTSCSRVAWPVSSVTIRPRTITR